MNEKLTNLTIPSDDDIPELGDDFFAAADLYHGNQLIKKGRPTSNNPKQAISIRFDSEIVEYFKSQGKGWQTAMNNALKEWIATHA